MSRTYKAFISYRHKPVDVSIAELLQKRIEHYHIPKYMRQNGEVRLGYVFRDRDELPLSSNLTSSIETALDNSEYLIVVCTPDTPQSMWVRKEIEYFLSHHDMDHVIVVLADGNYDESIPDELRYGYAEDGETILTRYEHLAADFTGHSERGWKRKIEREILRVYAFLLNCDYDALYRREQRYQASRRTALLGGASAILLAFIGLLLNRNAKIQEQLIISQVNESKALVGLSESALENGDRYAAIEYALNALPSVSNDRPYIPSAEKMLVEALGSYSMQLQEMAFAIHQDTYIRSVEMSSDGTLIATTDDTDKLRVFSGSNGVLLWELRSKDIDVASIRDIQFVGKYNNLLVRGYGEVSLLSGLSGDVLWHKDESVEAISQDGNMLALGRTSTFDSVSVTITVLSIEDGAEICEIEYEYPEDIRPYMIDAGDFSTDGKYLALIIEDHYNSSGDSQSLYDVLLFDLQHRTGQIIGSTCEVYSMGDSGVLFTPAYDVIAISTDNKEAIIVCYSANSWEEKYNVHVDATDDISDNYISWLESTEKYLCCGLGKNVFCLQIDTGEIESNVGLSGHLLSGAMYNKETGAAELMLETGVVTKWLPNGFMTYGASMDFGYYYDASFRIVRGVVLAGETMRDSQYVVVPNKHPETAVVVRYITDPSIESVEAELSEDSKYELYMSPSGETLLYVSVDSDIDTISGVLAKPTEVGYNTIPFSFEVEDVSYYDANEVVVTDEGLVAIRDLLLDIEGQTMSRRKTLDTTDSSNQFRSFISKEGGVVTAWLCVNDFWNEENIGQILLWQPDTEREELACPFEGKLYIDYNNKSCLNVGGDNCILFDLFDEKTLERTGFAVYHVTEERWNFIDNAGAMNGTFLAAFADANSNVAVVDSEGIVSLYDLVTGQCVSQYDIGVKADDLAHIEFAEEDSILLVFQTIGNLQFYDISDGSLLGVAYHRDRNLGFHSSASYTLLDAVDGHLLIQYYSTNYTQPALLDYNKETWEEAEFLVGVRGFVPTRNEYVLYNSGISGMWICHRYSLEELIELGNQKMLERLE